MNRFDRWIAIGGTSLGLAIGLLLSGCDEPPSTPVSTETTTAKYYYPSGGLSYTVIVIDGCEYIQRSHGLAHKGNCTNSIHIYKIRNK